MGALHEFKDEVHPELALAKLHVQFHTTPTTKTKIMLTV
jgi:hypothetical protein